MRGARQAGIAPSTIASGVGKSGSPAPNPMTSRPAALSALALASTASVADSLIAAMRAETRDWEAPGTSPSFRMGRRRSTRLGRIHRFDPLLAPDVHWRVRRACLGTPRRVEGGSSIGRVPVSKTGGWGFESLLPCETDTTTARHGGEDGR